jgi:hypothetical protein
MGLEGSERWFLQTGAERPTAPVEPPVVANHNLGW